MSTRSVIARVGQHEGTFSGRYCHWNGSPTWTGPHLLSLLKKKFKGNLQRMLVELVDNHPVGWSVVGEDCYCHPHKSKRDEFKNRKPETQPYLITEANIADSDAEFLYAFDAEKNRLYVRDVRAKEDAGIVELTANILPKKIWTDIECGPDLERCSHYARFHGLLPKQSNLSTQTWLGNRPLEFHDAVAFIIGGKRFASTGCGGNSDHLARSSGIDFRRNTWVASVKARNGRRIDAAVAKIIDGKYVPLSGVIWVYPPTMCNPQESLVSA
jgi:hypothetical protein